VSAGGFQVAMSALAATARTFDSESDTFNAIMPAGGPAVPDGGSGEVDAAMDAAVRLLGALHQQMAAVIADHGAKLAAAHDNYERTEDGLTQLIHSIGVPGSV
jgi:hypothetical protein